MKSFVIVGQIPDEVAAALQYGDGDGSIGGAGSLEYWAEEALGSSWQCYLEDGDKWAEEVRRRWGLRGGWGCRDAWDVQAVHFTDEETAKRIVAEAEAAPAP
jgi:hypothetical protein